ncbi:MAG: phosphomethylpyrimidine synthase ThiC [Candidatus Omnitrophica bacterium]|nr:phosphomethylpyrimidine synthase ThiC [Candidatus Omnitrophota bacterium]MBU1925080.1 phosphomethylpyrimidine synthase ThiC [Candidatus Omnitrophota bacterium]
MKTLLELTRKGKCPSVITKLARQEKIPPRTLVRLIAQGKAVIPANPRHKVKNPCVIGKNLRVKINANIGTSPEQSNIKNELKKLKVALRFGTDTVMDLSTGGDLQAIQKLILKHSTVPIGTVPIYETAICAEKKYGTFLRMTKDDILSVIEQQAKNGVDFFTIHCGITKKSMQLLERAPRKLGIVSRGGAIIAAWMKQNKSDNIFYTHFDEILKIAKRYDVTLSLGDALRPGSILDATDAPQLNELKLLGKLAQNAKRSGVQVMIEGPGHIPLNEIKRNIELEKKYCHNAPFYVLGPLVTDSALGYDHIAAAIGSAVAAAYGADFLCFVTPAEHLKLPDLEDIKLGVISSRIAAHSADLARGNNCAWKKDAMMTNARLKRDWKKQSSLSLDPEKALKERAKSLPKLKDVCTMCGRFCSIKLNEKSFKQA